MRRLQTIPKLHNRNSSPSNDSLDASDQTARRSENMARIRGQHTAPEVLLRKALWREGLRYRVHLRVEGTRPDIVFTSCRLAVFVDGCFWHGCPQHYVMPRSKMEFWSAKLATNTTRDRVQTRRLIANGWRVLRFWEHEVEAEPDRLVAEIIAAYRRSATQFIDRRMVVNVEPANPDGTQELWTIESLLESEKANQELRPRKLRK